MTEYNYTLSINHLFVSSMKNIFVYYLAILLPIPFLIWRASLNNTNWFAIFLITYAIPYRTLIDGWRLVDKKILKWYEIWKLWLPWKYRGFMKDLFFSI